MNSDYIIAGDWGTSTLRLYLLEVFGDGRAILVDSAIGSGVAEISSLADASFESTLGNLIECWHSERDIQHIILSGMIGSSIGWREVAYQICPTNCYSHAEQGVTFKFGQTPCTIMQGLRTENLLGMSDTMRGEETQLLGLSEQLAESAELPRLVALPGTHNKWALLDQGNIVNFITGFTGELFSVLRQHSVLISDQVALDLSSQEFERGVTLSIESNASLVHLLFNVRAQQLVDDRTDISSLAFMLGLIVGADIHGAVALFSKYSTGVSPEILLLGSGRHTDAYQRALTCLGVSSKPLDADEVAIAAYSSLYKQLKIKDS